jgi:hypothetical protein
MLALDHAEAIVQERLVRDAACIDLNESVAGYPVVPLTPRKFTLLRLLDSPYLPPYFI